MAFVRAGGEVSIQGLVERIRGAAALAFAHSDGLLVGVSALKLPQTSYRRRIGLESGTQLQATQFPYELGWVYVMPDARGKGLSLALSEAVLAPSKGTGAFATVRTDNNPMHRTLIKLGFEPAGRSFTSGRGKHTLQVFLRHAAQPVHAMARVTSENPSIRGFLLSEVLRFAERARACPGVQVSRYAAVADHHRVFLLKCKSYYR